MVLTFIGFSGCGKSHLARLFASELGWRHFCCDSLIENILARELDQAKQPGTRRVAHWLGEPSSLGFLERQTKYLQAEQLVMERICEDLKKVSSQENAIVDTTGSVIYMPNNIIETLRSTSKLIYLQIPRQDEELMFEQFIADPKPVVWLHKYKQEPNESPQAALRKSYPVLLHERAKSYERCAHQIISAGFADRPELTPKSVLTQLNLEDAP